MKIKLHKSAEKIVGAVRVSENIYDKISSLAKAEKVSMQEIIRAILDEVIDDIEV